MQLHTYPTPDDLTPAFADWLVDYENTIVKQHGRFTIALSGGNTPQHLYELLATEAYRDKLSWAQWHIFWGDERAVPFADERNNARMAYHALLDHVPVPASQIHVMRTDIDPDASMVAYDKILHQYFDGHETTFDLALMGMGDDGHTLSLFPGTPVIHEANDWTAAFFLPAQDMYRLTVTAPVVNRAAAVTFLLTGSGKAHALREILEGDYQPDTYPSQVIKPANGNLHWFVDAAAAELLDTHQE
ncbi:MAG: 6-phosphogluconolactonase [Bacteroidetes bacterium]|nr:6-phosphogluconolactonase [Fibrella sp.]